MAEERRTSLAPAGEVAPRNDLRDYLPGDRARAPGQRLGPLGARRGPDRPHGRRLPLPPVVPLRGRGHRERARRGRRAARLQPLGRAAARRGDDRQGDQGGALRARARCTSPSSTSSRAIPGFCMLLPKIGGVAAHPANVQRLLYDEQQLVLVFPEGRKGTEKLYKDRYRLRRFGRGGFVEAAMRARAPIVPIAVVGAEEAMPAFAQLKPLQRLTGPPLLPDHADLAALRPARHGRLPAGQVQDPLPAAGADRRPSATSRGRTRRSCRRSPTTSARRSRRSCSTWSASAGASGSGELQARSSSPGCRPTGAAGWRRRSSRTRRSRRSSASTAARRRSSCSAPSACRSPTPTR